MDIGKRLVTRAVDRPGALTAAMVTASVVVLALALLPTLFPQAFPMLAKLRVDTDPENMLSQDEPVRVFHNEMKKKLDLHDIVVVGVVNEEHPHGVFNPESLRKVHELMEFAKGLRWEDSDGEMAGVIPGDVIAPSTVDNVEQDGPGTVRFEWLMPEPPETEEAALALRDKVERLPFLQDTLVSEDGKALALYLPITSKDVSYRIYRQLQQKIDEFEGDDAFHITGLPVANDTFGVEMFIQMAISAPLAMLVIFLLMLVFFRKLVLIISPMILAMVSVILTMGTLIITGNTVHIMSSMIPIFIMPIAVLDSIHILSEFFDRYQETRDRRKTIIHVVETLFMPMLYTSLTSAAGFASLALTPIPPVQVFGLFVAMGILVAWFLTITFIPAYIMLLPEKRLENFGVVHSGEAEDAHDLTWTGRLLKALGGFTQRHGKLVLAGAAICVVVAVDGILNINVNDNPTRWFKSSHPIRVADQVLNSHFGGTYMAYLTLRPGEEGGGIEGYESDFGKRLDAYVAENEEAAPGIGDAAKVLRQRFDEEMESASGKAALLDSLVSMAEEQAAQAEGDAAWAWDDLAAFVESEQQRQEVFKQPAVLQYIVDLQEHLASMDTVGKSNSLADLVRTVYRELMGGGEEHFVVPGSSQAVAQSILTYESSHRPQDLYHFVTPDYRTASLWLQLKSGDNEDMSTVVAAVEDYVSNNPPPAALETKWFGLTYINVVWQEKMVNGMLKAFGGSFLVVLLMMTVLFRSAMWGMLCMIPLTITIGLIYGVIGLIGKDYDMPVAVLSSLTLGLAVDFAIHFLSRARTTHEELGSWEAAHTRMFGEPARAIFRNVVVIAVGFLPLLFAPLVPYITVGFFLASILLVSGAGTLLLLPVLIKLLQRFLFPETKACKVTCQCATCTVSGVVVVALIALNLVEFLSVGVTTLTWVSLGLLPLVALVCWLMSRRASCGAQDGNSA